jgi:hypothetical protein
MSLVIPNKYIGKVLYETLKSRAKMAYTNTGNTTVSDKAEKTKSENSYFILKEGREKTNPTRMGFL